MTQPAATSKGNNKRTKNPPPNDPTSLSVGKADAAGSFFKMEDIAPALHAWREVDGR
ncbi:hypothetical protein [Rhizobium rhizogenes]|uniref:hypothetical protein n=1 Tax=Rhizobium rhizogenes TaxID=359 RepID=UPI00226EF42F|nr:hypothetical protein [Rhizobium rhizogenes]